MAIPVIAIGASAGGVRALQTLTKALPRDFPAAILAVCHTTPGGPSFLAQVLARYSQVPVCAAEHDLVIEAGKLYTGLPDRHLMLEGNRLRLTRGPKENRTRPAIDVLFRSVAHNRGAQAIGVILTGYLDDGTAGLWAIKDVGGQAIVQEPTDAEAPDMPTHALRCIEADAIVRLAQLPHALLEAVKVSQSRSMSGEPTGRKLHIETAIARGENALAQGSMKLGSPSSLTCPECGGAMTEIHEGRRVRFRCHTGHAYSSVTLLADVDRSIDENLWRALRAMEERALLLAKLEEEAESGDRQEEVAKSAQALADTRKRGDVLRELLLDQQALGHELDEPK
jgi:two-component system, chemotaxis family, protein-glutamate methylesterase/glutaminase